MYPLGTGHGSTTCSTYVMTVLIDGKEDRTQKKTLALLALAVSSLGGHSYSLYDQAGRRLR